MGGPQPPLEAVHRLEIRAPAGGSRRGARPSPNGSPSRQAAFARRAGHQARRDVRRPPRRVRRRRRSVRGDRAAAMQTGRRCSGGRWPRPRTGGGRCPRRWPRRARRPTAPERDQPCDEGGVGGCRGKRRHAAGDWAPARQSEGRQRVQDVATGRVDRATGGAGRSGRPGGWRRPRGGGSRGAVGSPGRVEARCAPPRPNVDHGAVPRWRRGAPSAAGAAHGRRSPPSPGARPANGPSRRPPGRW